MKTILIAEDVDSNFLLLKAFLGRKYNLLRAKDGVEAVDLYEKHVPDLILMDIKMPNMDGLEATKAIRKISNNVPIIALTAFAFESDKQEALAVGCNGFLTKPVLRSSLEEMIVRFI